MNGCTHPRESVRVYIWKQQRLIGFHCNRCHADWSRDAADVTPADVEHCPDVELLWPGPRLVMRSDLVSIGSRARQSAA